MNLKAIIQKVVSWFKGEAKQADFDVAAAFKDLEARVSASSVAAAVESDVRKVVDLALAAPISPVFTASSLSVVNAATGAGWTISKGGAFNFTNSTNEVNMNNVNVAIQIALALKANDPSLTDAAVQAATNAALAAAYPAPAPTPAA